MIKYQQFYCNTNIIKNNTFTVLIIKPSQNIHSALEYMQYLQLYMFCQIFGFLSSLIEHCIRCH